MTLPLRRSIRTFTHHTHTNEKGTKNVTHGKRSNATQSPRTGVFATFGAFLGGKGSSALSPKPVNGTGAPSADDARRTAARAVRRLALTTALASFACLLCAGPAAAESPWWHLTSGARPTYLHAKHGGPAANEVQQLKIESLVFIVSPELSQQQIENEEFFGPGLSTELRRTSTAAEVQSGLETVNGYGPGSVEVAEVSPETFSVTFIGPLAGSKVALMRLGYEGTATITETTPGGAEPDGEIYVAAENLGDATVDGATSPVTITDTLPAGLRATDIVASQPIGGAIGQSAAVPCELATLSCEMSKALAPFDSIEVRIAVDVEPGAQTGELNQATISGGRAATASIAKPIVVSDEPTPFGVETYELANEAEGGGAALAAASHPFQQTTTIDIHQLEDTETLHNSANRPRVQPPALAKDMSFRWPPGLVGNPTEFPQCTSAQFNSTPEGLENVNGCPEATAVGVASTTVTTSIVSTATLVEPLFNLEPKYGEPARLGFLVPQTNTPVFIDPAVRSADGEDYGLTVSSTNITQIAGLLGATVTVWGAPGDSRHDNSRGWGCLAATRGVERGGPCSASGQTHPPAFLSLPTRCSGDMTSSVLGDSWNAPFPAGLPLLASTTLPTLGACNQVPFAPTIHSEPTSDAATSPTGLSFDLNFENEGLENSEGLTESEVKKAVVTLPQGFTTNPSVAEGLHACSEADFARETVSSQPGEGCPNESNIGSVTVESPLIGTKQAVGSLYVATQHDNPYNNLLTIYLVVRNPELGVIIKQALKVTPDPVTGQLTTEVDDIPQLPFSKFHLSFRQGQRSPLITPPACGTYAVGADLFPYSNPTVPLHRESSFQITSGPEGQGCPSGGVPPFHPNLEAGTLNNAAGTYSPFYTHITRKDSEQEITRFSIKLPPGVIGKLAGVSSCSDAQIAQAKSREVEGGGGVEEASPSCPKNSEVGHSLVGSGVGNVLAYAPGKLYLAGPYHGSNISLVSITAAKVGPFDLGTVVVRFALRIDPETAEVFVDSQGSDPIPHIVDGIPVHLRDIRAYVDRKDFTLNPTSCQKKSTASTILGSGLNFASEADDQPVTVTSPFQAADCANLGFAPKLGLSLKGATKRGGTPAFKAVLTYPKGSYANIAKSVVTLPHSEFLEQSHIKTICTRVQFKEGKVPGEKCPAASIYGKAEAVTPLLSEPLKGPVYLRSSSHNLPDLVASLHNKQVDFALDGRIDSVRNGRIRNTFETVPDAPVSKFVLEMQGGKKGLLVNSTNLCKGTNRAISEFTGQNGKLHNTNPVLSARCGGKGKKKSKSKK